MKALHIQKIDLEDKNFNPNLLRVLNFDSRIYSPGKKMLEKRYVWDYELEFITFSEGGMEIDDDYIDVKEGDIIFKRPGQYTRAHLPYACLVLGIDMNSEGLRIKKNNLYGKNNLYIPDYQHEIINAISTMIRSKTADAFQHLFIEILKNHMVDSPVNRFRIRFLLMELLMKLYNETVEKNKENKTPYKRMIVEVKQYIHRHLDSKMTLTKLSAVAGMSPSHFQKIFKQIEGESPNKYIQRNRIERAKNLIILESDSITDIAGACGFEAATYFGTVFRQYTNMTPTEYRKKYREKY